MIKFAEVSATPAMPTQPTPDPSKPTSFTIKKQGAVGHLVPGHKREQSVFSPEEGPPYTGFTPGKNVEKEPQTRVMQPHVRPTSDHKGPVVEKRASRYALRGEYPLDRYDHVKLASEFFDEWWKKMPVDDRHEYASNLVKRADELSIHVSDTARKYGADTLASEAEIKIAFDTRRPLLKTATALAVLNELENMVLGIKQEGGEKTASIIDGVSVGRVDVLVHTLKEFDKEMGLHLHYDNAIPDPFYSLLGEEKRASFSETIGNVTVTGDDLDYLARNRIHLVRGTFGEDMSKEFKKDPLGIYKSLPVSSRKVLAILAQSQNANDPVV